MRRGRWAPRRRRPLGVAPSVAPMVSVFAQENRPGTIWKPCTGVRCALTSRVKIWERRTARPSASLPALAVAVHVLQEEARALALRPLPVGVQVVQELGVGEAVLAQDALADGRQAVRRNGQGRAVDAPQVVLHAAARGVQTLFDGPVAHQVQRELGHVADLVVVVEVKALGQRLDRDAQVRGVQVEDLVDARLAVFLHGLAQCDVQPRRRS